MGKHLIRLRAVLPSRNEVQVEISEDATVRELKRLICSKVTGLKASEIRVLQKSMDLNDKGTLEYFRVFDGTKVDVVKKPPSASTVTDKSDKGAETLSPSSAAKSKAEKPDGSRSKPSGAAATSASGTARQVRVTEGSATTSGGRANENPRGADTTSRSTAVRDRPGSASTHASRPGSALRDSRPTTGSRPATGEQRIADSRSSQPAADMSDDEESEVLDRVARSVAELKRDLRDGSTAPRRHHDVTPASDPVVEMLQRRNASLEERLRRSEDRAELANQRIQELEQTVRRYQLLMRKVSVSMAESL